MAPVPSKGIIDRPSNHSVGQTVDRLKTTLRSKGVTLFALVDHSGDAEKVGMKMRRSNRVVDRSTDRADHAPVPLSRHFPRERS